MPLKVVKTVYYLQRGNHNDRYEGKGTGFMGVIKTLDLAIRIRRRITRDDHPHEWTIIRSTVYKGGKIVDKPIFPEDL